MRTRVAILLVSGLFGCRGGDVSASAPPPAAPSAVREADYRGELAGAKVYATFGARGTIASGSCFYDSGGEEVPLMGALDERGVLLLEETSDHGPASTIRLARGDGGEWFGTWSSADESRSGIARFDPLVRAPGEPVFVAPRHVVSENVDARIPVVLGLADREFEKKLDARLAELAEARPPPGGSVTVDYAVPLNERGVVSIEITTRRIVGRRTTSEAAGLTAAVDAGVIGRDVTDFVDVPKARAALDEATPDCDGGDPLPESAVLTERGVDLLVGACGARAPGWHELAFAKVRAAMRQGTPFSLAWSR